jgi:hypothetical protein
MKIGSGIQQYMEVLGVQQEQGDFIGLFYFLSFIKVGWKFFHLFRRYPGGIF